MRHTVKSSNPDPKEKARLLAQLRHDHEVRLAGYRDRALKLFPHICGMCRREFSGKRLRELTVHHKDHNWKNNPPDGSNWELLCIYCHENEHAEQYNTGQHDTLTPGGNSSAPSIANPFDQLGSLLDPGKDKDAGS